MRKYLLFLIAVPLLLISSSTAFATAGSVEVTPAIGTINELTVAFVGDTFFNSVQTALVIYDMSDNRVAIAYEDDSSETDPYFLDGASPKTFTEIDLDALPTGVSYTIAQASLSVGCCTLQQLINNSETLADLSAWAGGYMTTDVFILLEGEVPPAVTTSTLEDSLNHAKINLYTLLFFLLEILFAISCVIGAWWGVSRLIHK